MRLATEIQGISLLEIGVLEWNSAVIIYCRCLAVRVYSNPQGNPSPPLPAIEIYSIFSDLLCHRERSQNRTERNNRVIWDSLKAIQLFLHNKALRLICSYAELHTCHSFFKQKYRFSCFPYLPFCRKYLGHKWWETKSNSHFSRE